MAIPRGRSLGQGQRPLSPAVPQSGYRAAGGMLHRARPTLSRLVAVLTATCLPHGADTFAAIGF